MSDDEGQAVPLHRRRARRRNIFLLFLGIFVVAAIASVAFLGNLALSFDNKTQTIPSAFPDETLRPPKATEGPAAGALNILLLGSDSRGDAVDLAESGAASDQRSDTMMLAHIPADRSHIYLMSIMRDTWVTIPGHGEAKINAAMAFGGVPLVVETLEGMFQSRIDHVAIVDFEGFKAVTDALGGVSVDVTVPFTSSQSDYTFAAGTQQLNGDQALAFVRERYAFVDGDYQRVRNQQIFLKSLLSAVLTPSTLTNPVKITGLVDQVAPYVSVDAGLDAKAVGALALSLKSVRGSDVTSFTLPTLGTGTSADGQSIVLLDQGAVSAIAQALGDDSLGAYISQAGLG